MSIKIPLWFVVGFCLVFSGCGRIKDAFFDDEDEMTGQASRPVPVEQPEEPAPYPPNRKIYSSVGFYAKGYLWSRDEIMATGIWNVRPRTVKHGHNYVSIYASDTMRQAIQAYYRAEPEAPLVELWDMSGSGGGRCAGHKSHQNGLDIDIRYTYVYEKGPRSMATIDYQKLFSLVKAWVDTGKVRRFFVDSSIKRKLCSMYSGETEYLRRLRPYKNHDDHIHVRLKCPKEDAKCVDQVEVPAGSGC